MNEKHGRSQVSRRNAIKYGMFASGGLALGVTGIPILNSQADVERSRSTLVDDVRNHGHYAHFPVGPDTWGRSQTAFDIENGDQRWLAEPTASGGVRCLVKNLPANRNAGVDLHLGTLGEIEEISVTARTLQTVRGTGPAKLGVALYLDIDDNGEFFEWEAEDSSTDSWVGFGEDDEGIILAGANGELVLDDTFTDWPLVHAERTVSISNLRAGVVEGINAQTSAALYVGVASAGEGIEEAVIEDISVRRT